MTPTVPEFKAFKGFADISQSLEVIDKVPTKPPRGKKAEKVQIRENGKMRKKPANCGKVSPRQVTQRNKLSTELVSLLT